MLRDLRAHGTTLCIIDHKVAFLGGLADRAIAMHHGNKIAEGPPCTTCSQTPRWSRPIWDATMLELDGISVHYGKSHVLREVSLSVGAGEVVTHCRRQRRRQDDDAADNHGPQGADRRRDPL